MGKQQNVKTVIILSSGDEYEKNGFKDIEVHVKNTIGIADVTNKTKCVDQVNQPGVYSCAQDLIGQYLVVYRNSDFHYQLSICEVMAFNSTNLALDKQFQLWPQVNGNYSTEKKMGLNLQRYQNKNVKQTLSIFSNSRVSINLEGKYFIGALVILLNHKIYQPQMQNLVVYVGEKSQYNLNEKCYGVWNASAPHESVIPCNLIGQYITIENIDENSTSQIQFVQIVVLEGQQPNVYVTWNWVQAINGQGTMTLNFEGGVCTQRGKKINEVQKRQIQKRLQIGAMFFLKSLNSIYMKTPTWTKLMIIKQFEHFNSSLAGNCEVTCSNQNSGAPLNIYQFGAYVDGQLIRTCNFACLQGKFPPKCLPNRCLDPECQFCREENTVCEDIKLKNGSAWLDTDGYNCSFYQQDPLRRCLSFGSQGANQKCCACGGGIQVNGNQSQVLPIGTPVLIVLNNSQGYLQEVQDQVKVEITSQISDSLTWKLQNNTNTGDIQIQDTNSGLYIQQQNETSFVLNNTGTNFDVKQENGNYAFRIQNTESYLQVQSDSNNIISSTSPSLFAIEPALNEL